MTSPIRHLALLTALFLTACSDPRTDAIARLRNANAATLRTDTARLHTQLLRSSEQDYLPLRSNLWTDSLRSLKPLRIGLYRDGLAVALHDQPGVELGLHITPLGVARPPNPSPFVTYEQIEDGIYWYTLQR